MSTLPEQLSAARKSQVDAQLELFRSLSSKAVESAEKVMALNFSTGRASLEKSAAAVRQLLAAKDPRDLLALTTQTQENFETLLAYGSALFSIAASARFPQPAASAAPTLTLAPPPAPFVPPTPHLTAVPAPESKQPDEPSVEAKLEAKPDASVEANTIKPVKNAIVAAPPEAEPEVPAKAKPIAKAVSKVAPKDEAPAPAAAPLAAVAPSPVTVSGIKPVEAPPPPAPVSGKPAVLAKGGDTSPAKGSKKK